MTEWYEVICTNEVNDEMERVSLRPNRESAVEFSRQENEAHRRVNRPPYLRWDVRKADGATVRWLMGARP